MKHILLASILSLATTQVSAETTASLEIFNVTISSQIVDGVETEVRETSPVSSPVPGDRLAYRLTVANADAEPAQNIELTLPLDESVTLIQGSLGGSLSAVAEFSIQDGDNFIPESELEGTVPKKVRFHIKSLASEGTGTVEFDVLVK